MITNEERDYGWSEEAQKKHEQEYLRQQAKSITNEEYHQYASLFHRIMTDQNLLAMLEWSISETAEYFSVSWYTVRNWIRTSKLPAEHRLTSLPGAKHERWRWIIHVNDVLELDKQFSEISSTQIARKYKLAAVWDARMKMVKEAQSMQG